MIRKITNKDGEVEYEINLVYLALASFTAIILVVALSAFLHLLGAIITLLSIQV